LASFFEAQQGWPVETWCGHCRAIAASASMTCWYPAATSDSWFLAVRLFACTLVSSSKLALAAVVHESGQPPDEDMYLHDGLESDKQNTSVSACLVLSAQDASLLPIWFRRFSY